MKKKVGKVLNFVLIFGTLLVVLLVGINGQEMGNAVSAMRSMGTRWVVLALIAYFLFGAGDAFSLWFFLRRQGCRVSFCYLLFVANAGLYYSNITPGASGGQPMQVYYLHKKGVPLGLASSALMVRFFSFQAMLSVIVTVLWATHSSFVAEQIGSHMWILIVGYVYNLLLVCMLVLVALKKGIVRFFIRLFIKLGVKMHIVKDPAASTAKWEEALNTFHDSILLLKGHPLDLLVQLATGGAQLMALMTVLYFIYRGLGLEGVTYGQLMAMDVAQYVSAAYIPTPGASGAQEVSFSMYFGGIFPEGTGTRLAALLLWRFFTYYLSLIAGAIITVGYGWRVGKGRKAIMERPKDVLEKTKDM